MNPPRRSVDLGGDAWQFGQAPRRPFTSPEAYDLPAVAEWLPATVPGNVRLDLLALGRIPDPFFGEGYRDSLWVETVDWWYRRPLEVEPLGPAGRAFLVFEGIDYLSAVYVDGQELARHEGMFSRQVIEITPALAGGRAELAVRLWGSSALPRRQLNGWQRAWQKLAQPLYGRWVGTPAGAPDRSATLKCQMSFGWDFAPPIRTMGIWDAARLVISGPVFIAAASATAQPSLPAGPDGRALADFEIELTLEADRARQVQAAVVLSPVKSPRGGGAALGPLRFSLHAPAGASRQRLAFQLPEAALWQPWERGAQALYRLKITLFDEGAGGEALDQIVVRTGVRAVALDGWQISVNGQRLFARGLNWVPADSFPGRLRPERYAELLVLARESGANLLRVWGGGLREKQAFYDLCDELGLLVWQEFPFACMFLGAYPRDGAYLGRVEAECSAIVRQLRHHPSLALWCGGNEFSQSRNRPLLDTLRAVVQRHDGRRPFIPVSPSRAGGGDAHSWGVWHGFEPIRAYQAESARFLSEFGLQALPCLETLAAALPDPATGWETHHADLRKLARYASLFEPPDGAQSVQSSITSSQRAQAVALQTAIEHMRRRQGPEGTGGVCLWQFNEPWPAISWAIVDYFGRPKLAFERLQEMWYRPVLIGLNFEVGRRWQAGETFRAELWGVNDGEEPVTNGELEVQVEGEVVHRSAVDLPAGGARTLGALSHRFQQAPQEITLTLRRGGETIARNHYDLAWHDAGRGRIRRRLRRWIAGWLLR